MTNYEFKAARMATKRPDGLPLNQLQWAKLLGLSKKAGDYELDPAESNARVVPKYVATSVNFWKTIQQLSATRAEEMIAAAICK